MLERIEGAPAPVAQVPSMTLGTYLAEAGKALRTNLPKAWVTAVVLDAKATKRGISLELVEPTADEADDGRRADGRDGRLRGMLWSRTASEIERTIGVPLDAATLKGACVRTLIKTTFHPRWHLEGELLDLDPAVVPGLVARRMELIRETLRRENLFGAQHGLFGPADITSLAVIHPDRAAGWADIQVELDRLQARGILRVTSYPVPFEGAGSAGGIAGVLGTIGAGAPYDLVLIVRGGGAAAGLASLNTLALARAICRCPVPIVAGLGHACDRTLVDELAWRAADTPSKALGVVKAILHQRWREASDDHRAIVQAMERRVTSTLQPLLSLSRESLCKAADTTVATQAERLRDLGYDIERRVIAFRGNIDLMQADLDRLADDVLATAPAVPRTAAAGLIAVTAGIALATRDRLPMAATLSADARRSGGIIAAFVERQAADLRDRVHSLETTLRRRLADEASRLAQLTAEARALDLDATLARGFVLPLDRQRRIIRSAAAATAADRIELLFADGPVACRPAS